ncbi:MAG: hypothetical protein ABW004_16960 [Aeromicrobium sp.]
MASDLYIDGAMLERVRKSLTDVQDILSAPGRAMGSIDWEAMGNPHLAETVQEFGDEWQYGIEQLGKYSDGAVEALDAIRDAFDQADTDLADALNAAKEEG